MQKRLGLVFMLSVAAFSTPTLAENLHGEIGYQRGALGYDALVEGNYAKAITQLDSARGRLVNDPARLINLAQAYAKLGRTSDAREIFSTVANHPRQADLILADGSIMNSRVAAQMALQKLDQKFAVR